MSKDHSSKTSERDFLYRIYHGARYLYFLNSLIRHKHLTYILLCTLRKIFINMLVSNGFVGAILKKEKYSKE